MAREAVLLSTLLCALTVLATVEHTRGVRAPSAELALRAFSRGEKLGRQFRAEQGLHGEICVGAADLNGPSGEHGLRVATISPRRELIGFRNFDLAEGDLAELETLAGEAPLESSLVFAAHGALELGESERERAARLLATLGAEAPPLQRPTPSWAFACVRRARGWVRLAESRGESAPTRLSFLLRESGYPYELASTQLRVDRPDGPAARSTKAPTHFELVSCNGDGAQGDARSASPSLSADGRVVAFASEASNLVPGDDNECSDVFVRELDHGRTVRVSVASDGSQVHAMSVEPALSADGMRVVFQSAGDELAPDDTNGCWDVFAHDRASGETRCISRALDGASGDDESLGAALSSDGAWIAFTSRATNLIALDRNEATDVFVGKWSGGELERVSVASDGAELDGDSKWAALSEDGRFVAFASNAGNVVAGSVRGRWDVYVRDLVSRRTELVSGDWPVGARVGDSLRPSLSGDGSLIAFESRSVLAPVERARTLTRIFVRDRKRALTLTIDPPPTSDESDADCRQPVLSGSGRYVAFVRALAAKPASGRDPDGHTYRFDLELRRLECIDEREGAPAEPGYFHHSGSRPALSRHGSRAAFAGAADGLVESDRAGVLDVFVREFPPDH